LALFPTRQPATLRNTLLPLKGNFHNRSTMTATLS
jgi:hypothetical protein